jgi:hypothetical protein
MKPLSIVVLALLMATASLVASAQPPGYMGRRTILKAGVSLLPANQYHYGGPYNWSGKLGFYFNHTEAIGIEHVTSRRSSVSITADLTRMGYKFEHLSERGRNHITSYGFGLMYKGYPFLQGSYISPVGPYFGMGYRYLYVRQHWVPDATGLIEKQLYNISASSFSFMYGYSQIIGDRVMLDLGLKFSFSMPVNAALDESVLPERYARADRVKLYIGLGLLLGK